MPKAEPTPARLESDHLAFILGGKAFFTIRIADGERITYKVTKPSPDKPHFVSVLFGPDNWRNYKFIGTIFEGDTFRIDKKPGAFSADTVSVALFEMVFAGLVKNEIPQGVEIWHAGKCRCCGKLLTDPDSIAAGIGPSCAAKAAGRGFGRKSSSGRSAAHHHEEEEEEEDDNGNPYRDDEDDDMEDFQPDDDDDDDDDEYEYDDGEF